MLVLDGTGVRPLVTRLHPLDPQNAVVVSDADKGSVDVQRNPVPGPLHCWRRDDLGELALELDQAANYHCLV